MTNLNFTNTSTTTSGNKLDQKLSDWIHSIENGDTDYFAITTLEGKMFYVCGKNASELVSCNVLIDKGNGLEVARAYNSGNATSGIAPFTLIVKKDKRLIINDNGQIAGFGVKDVAPTVKTLFVHAKTDVVHTFIAASDSSSQVEVFKAMSIDCGSADPILHCMNAIFTSVEKQRGKEVV